MSSVVFAGEIYGQDWHLTISIAHTQSERSDKKALKFHIFDMVSLEDWTKKTSKVPYFVRKETLRKIFKGNFKNIVIAPEMEVPTYHHATIEYKTRLNEGYEGVVLKELDAVYPFDRSEFWLKWRPVQTQDVRILRYEGGKS